MEKDLIYDVGMNNGDDTAYYLFKGYRVVAIEADPDLVKNARRRFEREIEDRRLTLLNVAIGEDEDGVEFWICDNKRVWNSLGRDMASRQGLPCHSIDLPSSRFRTVLDEYGVPHYLKVDIEGADRYCLNDLDPADAPAYVSIVTRDPLISDPPQPTRDRAASSSG